MHLSVDSRSWLTRQLDSGRTILRRIGRSGRGSSKDIVLGVRQDLDASLRSLWGLRRPLSVLSPRDQDFHTLIWGSTGSGKSKLLESLFLQHLAAGHGVGLLEPHSDLSADILRYLVHEDFFHDARSFERLVYLDFAADPYVPFNILTKTDRPHETAMQALDGMVRTFPELAGAAPMFKTVFTSAAHVLTVNGRPITEMFRLLTDPPFRRKLLLRTEDSLVLQTLAPLESLAPREVEVIVGSTLRRIFQLGYPLVCRRSLGAKETTLDFRKMMDAGRAVLINLGNAGDAVSKRLLGSMIMVQLEQAALSRTDLSPDERTPMTFMVDEWSSVAAQADTIKNVLDQTRKFGLRLYLSGQSLSQLDSDRLSGAVENCRLSISFGLGRRSAELQVPQIMTYDPAALIPPPEGQVVQPAFASVDTQRELWVDHVMNLGQREAVVKRRGEAAEQVRTLFVQQPEIDPEQLEVVLSEYARRYCKAAGKSPQTSSGAFGRMETPDERSTDEAYTRAMDDPDYWDASQDE